MKTAFIFVPDILSFNEIGMLEGFSESNDDNVSFYITNCNLVNYSSKSIGYCSEVTPEKDNFAKIAEGSEWIHVNLNDGAITIVNQKEEYNKICINYAFKTFVKSEITSYKSDDYGTHFEVLVSAIKTSNYNKSNNHKKVVFLMFINFLLWILNMGKKVLINVSNLCKYSETATHFQSVIENLQTTFLLIKLEQKLTLQTGSTLLARILDFFLGIIVLYWALTYEDKIISFVEESAVRIVESVKHLLTLLKGSPYGLKLNDAFNKTLGSFFLYHLTLWRGFLFSLMSPFLHYIFRLLIIPGCLGITFQIALVEDFVRFSTLHVYCIYVYAARLYRVNVVGLGSLWPLFIGRKYNPLRNRIDSHQYSHHQLFIGTLGFTVLLFLWPTTCLYYCIFATLRVGLILLGKCLIYIRQLLQYLPVYVFLLWIINSSLLAGTIKMKIVDEKENLPLTLHATLLKLSLKESILLILPNTSTRLPPIKWSTLVKNLFHAVLL